MKFKNSILVSISLIALGLQAQADCLQQAEQALNACQSKAAIESSQATSDKITSDFKPNNDRMSAESCQGFKDSYEAYDQLVDDYIENCRTSLIENVGQCLLGEIQEDSPNKKEKVAQILALQNRAVEELPKLKHLKAPMPKMKTMLDDCLRQTQGKDIKNTNKDRGNADMSGQASKNDGAGGNSSQQAQDGGGRGGGGSGGGGSDGGGSPQSSGESQAKAKTSQGSVATQTAAGVPIVRGYNGAGSGKAATAAVLASSPLARAVAHQKQIRALMMRKPASNEYGIQGFSGPHTNMFQNIKTRYREMKSQGDFL